MAILALILVTAVWGVTFVQVKDAVAIYPLFAFLGALLGAGYALQTAGLARTTVSGAGFVTGMYVVLTPLIALVLFRARIRLAAWVGTVIAIAGLALLSGVHAGSAVGDLLVLAGAGTYALQIVLMERYAPRSDPLALTLVE